jgi:hypothetical protein
MRFGGDVILFGGLGKRRDKDWLERMGKDEKVETLGSFPFDYIPTHPHPI